jgi:peptidoglycan/LPS O-acetylase OafA/YrhL
VRNNLDNAYQTVAKPEIYALTGLRFFAAAYVFIFHIHIRWPLAKHGFWKSLLDQGAIGMGIFFILSGFVLAYRYADDLDDIKSYLMNRFARIYPVYFIVALLSLPNIGIVFETDTIPHALAGFGKILLLVITNVIVVQAWLPQFFAYWNNGASWSISVEMFFYVLLPVALPALVKCRQKTFWLIVMTLYFMASLPGLSAALFASPKNDVFYSVPIFRLPEFLLGVCSYLYVAKYARGNITLAYQLLIVTGSILYIGFFGQYMPLYIGHNWITVPLVIAFMLSLLNSALPFSKLFATPLVVWLGKISYCFYSFQIIVISFILKNNYSQFTSFHPLFKKSWFVLIFAFALLMLFSVAGYYGIEEPCRKWLKRRNNKSIMPAIAFNV